MATKGASNHYGNARGGQAGHRTMHTGFAWAKAFNKHTLRRHFKEHGLIYGENGYVAHAVSFANRVDRINHISHVRKDGCTVKYSKKTNEFAVIDKNGYIVTYFYPSEGIKAYYRDRRTKK